MEQTLLNEIVARVAAKLAEEEGLTYIHPFNDLEGATGQGTIAYEIFQDLPDVDIILVPIGGGGLGSMALNLGYQRRMFIILWVSVIVLVILVQVFQTIGTHFSISLDRRLTSVKKKRKGHSAEHQD